MGIKGFLVEKEDFQRKMQKTGVFKGAKPWGFPTFLTTQMVRKEILRKWGKISLENPQLLTAVSS